MPGLIERIRSKLTPLPPGFMKHPAHLLAFGFGSGLSPVMPGTVGTLAAVPVFLLLQPLPLPYYTLVVMLAAVLGVWVCGIAARNLGVHDHSGIVWDEFVGYFITMFAAPAGWIWIIVGFLLFRLFDIVKPWPIGLIDRKVHGGLGIMLDDVLAGMYAAACLQALVFFDVVR